MEASQKEIKEYDAMKLGERKDRILISLILIITAFAMIAFFAFVTDKMVYIKHTQRLFSIKFGVLFLSIVSTSISIILYYFFRYCFYEYRSFYLNSCKKTVMSNHSKSNRYYYTYVHIVFVHIILNLILSLVFALKIILFRDEFARFSPIALFVLIILSLSVILIYRGFYRKLFRQLLNIIPKIVLHIFVFLLWLSLIQVM